MTKNMNKELEKAAEQIDKFDASVKELTLDRMNQAPVLEQEPQTKLSNREMNKYDAPYIKPVRSVSRGKAFFDEKNRELRNKDWEYVKCTVENYEIIGEAVEVWTGKWGCDPAHFWKVPVNKPIYLPRHLAVQLSNCKYHRLIMDQTVSTGADGGGQYFGSMAVDSIKQRIDCRPVSGAFSAVGF